MTQLLHAAIRAALAAGHAIVDVYNSPDSDWEVERKADNSPLTLADRKAHAVISSHLEPFRIPLLSEEGAHAPYADREAWRELWVVDPLDGTKEFLKRNGEFTVNIALVRDGAPVMGVIYVPVARTLYFGTAEGGARKVTDVDDSTPQSDIEARAESIHARTAAEAGGARPYTVVASRSHLSLETTAFIDALRPAHPDLESVSAGSSLKLCLVAEGAADVYPRFAPTMEWDTAAGDAVCRAAGCRVVAVSEDLSEVSAQAEVSPDAAQLSYNKPDLHNPWFVVLPL